MRTAYNSSDAVLVAGSPKELDPSHPTEVDTESPERQDLG